ncbi:MAG: hypothetical protein HUK06_09490 [Bacteroidaceae bacterium]|nr:hypothetical protein [Bacteroidaceae bacterium]
MRNRKHVIIIILLAVAVIHCLAQDTMTLTMYRAAKGRKTADGTVITDPTAQRICAMSHDMLKKYPFGTKVRVEGYGDYVVRDKMGKRHKKTIDILIPKGTKAISKRKVMVTKCE